MGSKLLAVSAIGFSRRKAVPSGRIMLRRVIIGIMAAVLLSLTGAGVASAQAETQRVVTRDNFDETGGLICTSGEQHITGIVETVVQLTKDAAGGTTIVTRTTGVDFTAVDTMTSQRYRINGSVFGNSVTHVGENGFPAITTNTTIAQVIAVGPPNPGAVGNVVIQSHITVNANGDVVADHALDQLICPGQP
jgi:hypothetical protein